MVEIENRHILLFLLVMITMFSCDLNGSRSEPQIESLSIEASHLFGVSGNQIPIKIKVKGIYDNGQNTQDLEYKVMANGENFGKLTEFTPATPGIYELYATYEELHSDTLLIEIRPAKEYEIKEYSIIFHVVHDGEKVGEGYNIPNKAINYQMSLLRSTFETVNTLRTPNSAAPRMKFKLAEVDPNGVMLEEPGVNRFQRENTSRSILFQNWMWEIYWDPDFYINVWVGDTKNGYSWGIYPDLNCDSALEGLNCTDLDTPYKLEGIALELDNLWEGNWVFPHEMGHYFGLFHVFGANKCNSDSDFSNDTYYYDREIYESGDRGTDRISCSGVSYVSYNIMDYWNQPPSGREISYDQVERIRFVIENGKFRGNQDPQKGSPRNMIDFKPK